VGNDTISRGPDAQPDGGSPTKEILRLWLRALTFTNLVEQRVRTRLRVNFDVTLPPVDGVER
jgi:hypothetical protein